MQKYDFEKKIFINKINRMILFNKIIYKKKKNFNKIFYLIIILLIVLGIIGIYIIYKNFMIILKNYNFERYHSSISKYNNDKLDYDNNVFVIFRDMRCASFCGLFSFYIHYLGCINKTIIDGKIPIIDLESFPNIFNGFNTSINENAWEYFFEQPLGYKLKDVKKYAKNIQYSKIINGYTFKVHNIYNNTFFLNLYHKIAKKYLPIKQEIIKESNIIMRKLFKGSTNILGILTRGTDYVAARPKGHPIPPTVEMVSHDIKEMDKKYNYDFFFVSTEDDIIRENLINEFGYKLKYLKSKTSLEYNYEKKEFLFKNKNLLKNIDFNKIYVINIFILSKCIDIISARTGGAVILFIISEGFRNQKVYYLGTY